MFCESDTVIRNGIPVPLSLVRTTEELLEGKVAAPV
jgi:hypothetical protein